MQNAALQALERKRTETRLIPVVVNLVESEPAGPVRSAAVAALGRIGNRQPLAASGMTALVDYLAQAADDQALNTAVAALGQAANSNVVPAPSVLRIAAIFGGNHAPWLDGAAAAALGRIGAAQALPAAALEAMNRAFADPSRRGQADDLAQAFRVIAESRHLPEATLDLITTTFEDLELGTSRTALMYALAYDADVYPRARATLERAAALPEREIADAARHGLRVLESRRLFAGGSPFEIALDAARPVAERIQALAVVRANRIEPERYADVVRLAASPEPEVAAAALGLFRYIAAGPTNAFDRSAIIPALQNALAHEAPAVRIAAHGALAMVAARLPRYWTAADFPARLDAATRDDEPGVRRLAYASLIRAAPDDDVIAALLERAVADPAPFVRGNVAGWLSSDGITTSRREYYLTRLREDPDADVRAAAADAVERWQGRERAWPIAVWTLLTEGRFKDIAGAIFVAVSVIAPLAIGAGFFIYLMARALTRMFERRWGALAALPVFVIWGAASYGMFMLFFMLAHAGSADAAVSVEVSAIVWVANVLYGSLAYGLHFFVRN